jgi:hypothetical protein
MILFRKLVSTSYMDDKKQCRFEFYSDSSIRHICDLHGTSPRSRGNILSRLLGKIT